jgi:hypothetical protein
LARVSGLPCRRDVSALKYCLAETPGPTAGWWHKSTDHNDIQECSGPPLPGMTCGLVERLAIYGTSALSLQRHLARASATSQNAFPRRLVPGNPVMTCATTSWKHRRIASGSFAGRQTVISILFVYRHADGT